MHLFRSAAVAGAFALAAAAPAADYGTVKGTVKLAKPKPAAPVNVSTDRDHCLSKGPVTDQTVLSDAQTGGLRYVFVYLRPDSDDRTAKFPADKVHPDLKDAKGGTFDIDQPCCQFEPRVFAVRAGTRVTFKNSSPVSHNVNYKSEADSFNETVPPGKDKATKPTVAEPALITFECNIHPWMKGYGLVFDHPYFAVTDAAGNFTMDKVPVGKWRVVYRHETGYYKGAAGRLGQPVEVKLGDNTLPPLVFENNAVK